MSTNMRCLSLLDSAHATTSLYMCTRQLTITRDINEREYGMLLRMYGRCRFGRAVSGYKNGTREKTIKITASEAKLNPIKSEDAAVGKSKEIQT